MPCQLRLAVTKFEHFAPQLPARERIHGPLKGPRDRLARRWAACEALLGKDDLRLSFAHAAAPNPPAD
jgi:hypothetical protein